MRTSLKELELTDCPKLLASMIIGEDNYDRGFLPASLASLRIVRCGLYRCIIVELSPEPRLSFHIRDKRVPPNYDSSVKTSDAPPDSAEAVKNAVLPGPDVAWRVIKSLLETAGSCCLSRLLESTNADGENGQVILPSVLESLELNSCGVNDNSLSVCLQNLSSLSALCIYCCNGIVSLPPATVFRRLTMLAKLDIFDCQELTSAVGLSALTRRRFVRIVSCPKLADLSSISSQLWAYLD
uniref:Uncharacterized protein n=1 Tax=Ananas comosus var. bracteatus TaxID=296719 RepID=A0A6V7PKP2_ANACO|nr:unnamed protein product [Ananas comosus var. bracteatus]